MTDTVNARLMIQDAGRGMRGGIKRRVSEGGEAREESYSRSLAIARNDNMGG
ncbi:MAG: hypothetical protein ACT4NX_02985 [Deltaproteobacteria bacterium]